MPIKRVRHREPQPLSQEQKIAFVLLLFLGFGGVILGFKSFGSAIRRPFDLQIANYLNGEKFVSSSQKEAAELEASKSRDVDGDGLVDYDELYLYKTSPYLADSDSDGFDDKTEVFSGNDPTCPEGQPCGFEAEQLPEETTVIEGLVEPSGSADAVFEAGAYDFQNPADVEEFFKQATLSEIRGALLKAGLTQAELDQISDEQLVEFFTKTFQEASEQGALESIETRVEP